MSLHRNTRRLASGVTSVRVRALLSLGVALGIGSIGTFAFWTDDSIISGTSFTSGTLDLKVNNVDDVATTTLSMSNMTPGSSSAELLTIKNNGSTTFKYSVAGGLAGTDASTFATAAALKLAVVAGGTRSGTGNTSTCTGGTVIVSAAVLTNTTTTVIVPKRGPLAAAGTEALCFQVTFDAAASNALQGKTATVTFTATGTSDLS
ncbi:TasA family protein [Aeromicrobium sp.]|uniref:TasA family protein n=1 Tax=Aeromicrobium sp. TaxID=1871063 RepID=UPI0030C0DBF6